MDWPIQHQATDQDGEADEAFYSQLKGASQSQALVLMGDLNHPDICCEGYTAKHVQSRRFLQCIDDNFLTQLVEEPTRRGVLLDLVLTNKEGLVEDIKVGGSLGCSDHEKIEFRIVGSMRKTTSRTETLDFGRANFDLFKKLLGEIPQVKALEGQCFIDEEGKDVLKTMWLLQSQMDNIKNDWKANVRPLFLPCTGLLHIPGDGEVRGALPPRGAQHLAELLPA
ncbi:glycerol kinase [Limosa lapponica baueri]|uniref:Glycerol kinase n=1 Tax=Limosa lapponica baueri TaxID=1758121 RepID=A0A2I0TTB6_LIMLA|nr:glycerol kinase [Limosa lapponica baueri]